MEGGAAAKVLVLYVSPPQKKPLKQLRMNGGIQPPSIVCSFSSAQEERQAHLTNQYMQRMASVKAVPNP